MAFLKFVASDINSNELVIKDIVSYELSKDIDAACDGLRIIFNTECAVDELKAIKAYYGDCLIFNGFVDSQSDSINANGRECFVYARSSACVLLDNEAEPRSYYFPSTASLFSKNAQEFGFVNKLPLYAIQHSYLVGKGVSCYGAINNFIKGITGKSICVNPNNELIIPQGEGCVDFDKLDIISEKRTIGRGRLVSLIDYKIDGDMKYSHHIKSRFLERNGIRASKKINLTTLPVWQREGNAKHTLSKNAEEYYKIEAVVLGGVAVDFYDRAIGTSGFGELDGYYVAGLCISYDIRGERTKITLCKKLDLEEISYVVE